MNTIFFIRIPILLYFIFGAFSSDCQKSEDPSLYYQDSLNYYTQTDDLIRYLKVLDDTHTFFLKKRDFNSIKLLSNNYLLFRNPKNKIERTKARFSYTLNAFTYYKKLGDNINALKFYELAHENLENKLEGDKLSWYIENVIGNIYTTLAEYEKAEYYFNIVERYLGSTGNDKDLSRLYVNKSRSLSSQKRIDDAISILNSAKKITHDEQARAGIYLNLVDLMLISDRIDSCKIYLDSFEFLDSHIKKERLYYYYELQGDLYIKENKFKDALRLYDRSYAILVDKLGSPNRRQCAKLINKMSQAYLDQEDLNSAEAMLKKAFNALNESYDIRNQTLPNIVQLYADNTFYELLFQYSLLAFEKYNRSDLLEDLYLAQEAVVMGLYVNRMLGYSNLATSSKMIPISQNKKLLNIGLDILFELKNREGIDKWLADINEMFDFSKSLNLVDKIMNKNRLFLMASTDRDSIHNWQNKLTELYFEKSKVTDNRLIDSLSRITFLLEEKITSFLGYGKKLPSYDVSDVPLFIEYVVTSDNVYSINNCSGDIKFVRNCTFDELQLLQNEFIKYVRERLDVKDRSVLRKLCQLLVTDLKEASPKVTIIPDGLLSAIPFDILMRGDGKYLIENHTIFYAMHKVQLTEEIGNRKIVNKLYTLSPKYNTDDLISITREGSYQLEYAEREVKNIEILFPKISYSSSGESKDSVMSNLKDGGIFHFSGHAMAKQDNAYLVLSNEKNDFLSFADISEQFYNFEMVFLSACETGLGGLAIGDGLQSLARAFMHAGTKTVLNSLWTVDDKSTSIISGNFYKSLKKGKAIDIALRNAKLDYLRESPIENQHPYFWAGVIGVGDYSPLEFYQHPLNKWYWTLIFLIILLLFWKLYLRNKLKK